MSSLRAYLPFHCILTIILLFDQVSKFLADKFLAGKAVSVFPKFVFLSYTRNTGAAWSIFSGNGELLGVAGVVVLATIFFTRKHLNVKQRYNQIIYGTICAGILGNIIDRLLYGHVVDFVDVRFGSYRWPVFNIADSAICCGVFLCFLFTFLPKNKEEPKIVFH
jgi:signal peptidase II